MKNNDFGHVEYINRILAAADKVERADRKESTIYALKLSTSAGVCFAWLFRDINDGIWYDTCQYQLSKSGGVVVPVYRSITTPKNFCEQFLFPKSTYTVLCSGGKVQKPTALKGIRRFASVPCGCFQYQCQLFLQGDDLYIKHSDYFSPEACEIVDCQVKGTVWICKAWLKISNFVPMVKLLDAPETAYTVWKMIRECHRWGEQEYNLEWERFLKDVAKATQEYLEKGRKTHE